VSSGHRTDNLIGFKRARRRSWSPRSGPSHDHAGREGPEELGRHLRTGSNEMTGDSLTSGSPPSVIVIEQCPGAGATRQIGGGNVGPRRKL